MIPFFDKKTGISEKNHIFAPNRQKQPTQMQPPKSILLLAATFLLCCCTPQQQGPNMEQMYAEEARPAPEELEEMKQQLLRELDRLL